jgi:hypothetical protein
MTADKQADKNREMFPSCLLNVWKIHRLTFMYFIVKLSRIVKFDLKKYFEGKYRLKF